jgi:hypothetical protein
MKPRRGSGFPLEPVLVALTALACLLAVSQRLTG